MAWPGPQRNEARHGDNAAEVANGSELGPGYAVIVRRRHTDGVQAREHDETSVPFGIHHPVDGRCFLARGPTRRYRQAVGPCPPSVGAPLEDDLSLAVAFRINGENRATIFQEHGCRMPQILARLSIHHYLTMMILVQVHPDHAVTHIRHLRPTFLSTPRRLRLTRSIRNMDSLSTNGLACIVTPSSERCNGRQSVVEPEASRIPFPRRPSSHPLQKLDAVSSDPLTCRSAAIPNSSSSSKTPSAHGVSAPLCSFVGKLFQGRNTPRNRRNGYRSTLDTNRAHPLHCP